MLIERNKSKDTNIKSTYYSFTSIKIINDAHEFKDVYIVCLAWPTFGAVWRVKNAFESNRAFGINPVDCCFFFQTLKKFENIVRAVLGDTAYKLSQPQAHLPGLRHLPTALSAKEQPVVENESNPDAPAGAAGKTGKSTAKGAKKAVAGNAGKAARLSEKSRRAIQESKDNNATLARRFRRNPKTIAIWRGRSSPESARMGPKTPMPRLLTAKEEVVIIAFRMRTRLPLEDCLVRLHPLIPNLNRTQLYRCLRRYGLGKIGPTAKAPRMSVSPLNVALAFDMTLDVIPLTAGAVEEKNQFDHLFLFVLMAFETLTKRAFAQVVEKASPKVAAQFLLDLVDATPQKISTVTTPRTPMFTEWDGDKIADAAQVGPHPFRTACLATGVLQHVAYPDGAALPEITMKW
jgi:hypothetical protein